MLPVETLADGIERAGTDVSVHHAQSPQGQGK